MKRIILALALLLSPGAAHASVTVVVNGSNYTIPQTSERGWGTNVTSWIQAISAASLYPNSGTFTLGAELDFGASYGLKSLYYKSRTSNPASSGQIRLANTDVIAWRNSGNSGNLSLTPNATDGILNYNGVQLLGASLSQTVTNKTIDADSNTITNIENADIKSAAGIVYSKLNLTGGIVNADVNASAAIARSKVASGTAYRILANASDGSMSENAALTSGHVVYADSNGQLAGEAALSVSRGGTGLSNGTSGGVLGFTASGTLASSGALAANQLVIGGGAGATPSTLGSLGTTTTVLHGNAAGAPTFGAVSLTADVSGVLPLANGGTGTNAASANAAFNALSPMTTGGDIIYGGASGAATRLANGTSGQVLTSAGGTSAPTWSDPASQLVFWSASQLGSGGGWTTASTSYGDLSVATTDNALTSITSQTISCVKESTKLPGITCTLVNGGYYQVMASFSGRNASTSSACFRLVDGSSTVINAGICQDGPGGGIDEPYTLMGLYASGGTSITFKVQALTSNGTNATSIHQTSNSPITWTVVRIR